jgi:8-oxo-dGTP diphosphatase
MVERIGDFIPGISMDCVVFGYKNKNLHVLLLKYRGTNAWSLPGGFLPKNEEMDAVVGSILRDRTGVDHVFLEQFHTFSSLRRAWDSNELSRATLDHVKKMWAEKDVTTLESWFGQRFITTAYVAMIDTKKVNPKPDLLSEDCTWVAVDQLPLLVLDHCEIIDKALEYLRKKVNYLPIGRELLEDKFTMLELQSLYEAILGVQLDRGNFQRKMMKMNMLIRLEKKMTGAQNKAPYFYQLDDKVYDKLLAEGIGFS